MIIRVTDLLDLAKVVCGQSGRSPTESNILHPLTQKEFCGHSDVENSTPTVMQSGRFIGLFRTEKMEVNTEIT
jgi:hypothetical protein